MHNIHFHKVPPHYLLCYFVSFPVSCIKGSVYCKCCINGHTLYFHFNMCQKIWVFKCLFPFQYWGISISYHCLVAPWSSHILPALPRLNHSALTMLIRTSNSHARPMNPNTDTTKHMKPSTCTETHCTMSDKNKPSVQNIQCNTAVYADYPSLLGAIQWDELWRFCGLDV